jgi:arabinogalactan oligomer/maltooligosaccharide transport system permease protein
MRRLSLRGQIASQATLALVASFVIIPIWALAYLAFDGGVTGWPTEFRSCPEQFTLGVFEQVWQRAVEGFGYLDVLRNSLFVSGGAALLAVECGASMAYAFARLRFPGKRVGLFALLLGALLPPVALMTPLYILLTALHLRTTLLGLTLVYTSFSLPFCIWNMRAAFQAVPKDLEESAFMDGAGYFTAFWRVTLPLALPSIAIAGLIAFLIGYSEFAMGWLFVSKNPDVTLAMAISGMLSDGFASWSNTAALAMLMSVPVALICLVLQRYLLSGLLIGMADPEG